MKSVRTKRRRFIRMSISLATSSSSLKKIRHRTQHLSVDLKTLGFNCKQLQIQLDVMDAYITLYGLGPALFQQRFKLTRKKQNSTNICILHDFLRSLLYADGPLNIMNANCLAATLHGFVPSMSHNQGPIAQVRQPLFSNTIPSIGWDSRWSQWALESVSDFWAEIHF